MNLITIERPASELDPVVGAGAPVGFPASEAFAVLRAWRAWAAQERHEARTGFRLLRAADGALVLAGEDLGSDQVAAIGRHSHRRPRPLSAAVATPDVDTGAPDSVLALRALDDWAIETFLRAGAQVCRSSVIALRHRAGRFELVAWPRQDAATADGDAHALRHALNPWIAR